MMRHYIRINLEGGLEYRTIIESHAVTLFQGLQYQIRSVIVFQYASGLAEATLKLLDL